MLGIMPVGPDTDLLDPVSRYSEPEIAPADGKDETPPVFEAILPVTDSPAGNGDIEKSPTGDGDSSPYETVSISKGRAIALVITVTGAALMNTMSVQAMVIVLPTIGRDLDIPAARQQWIVSSYALAFGCFLLIWGRLADVYGKRLIFILGSAWVCIVTLVCPFVPSEIGFNTMRGLQGLGGAANVPTAIGILGVTFPPGKAKNYAFAMYSSGAPMGSILGNFLAGVVGQYASWKWIFWILAIIAAATTVAGHFVIPLPVSHPSESELKNAVDWIGGMIVTIALFILMFALTEGNIVGWSQPYIPTIIVVSLLLLTAFVLWQLRLEKSVTRKPLVKMSIFRNLRVSAALIVMALFFAGFTIFLVFVTFYFQDFKGLDPIETTLRFIPSGVAGICSILVISQVLARIKIFYIIIFGTLCLLTSNLLFAVPIPPDTTYWAFGFPAICLSVMAADTLFPSLVLLNSHSLPREDQALGGALINAVGQTSRAIGLAIGIAIQVAVQERHEQSDSQAIDGSHNQNNTAYLTSLRAGQWFGAGLGLAAVCVAAFGFRGTGLLGHGK